MKSPLGLRIGSVQLGWLPVQGYTPLSRGLWPFLRQLILPALTLGFVYVALITAKSAVGLSLLAAAAQGWAIRRTTRIERALLVLAGLFFVFPSLLEALLEASTGLDFVYPAIFGLVIGAAVLVKQIIQPGLAKTPA